MNTVKGAHASGMWPTGTERLSCLRGPCKVALAGYSTQLNMSESHLVKAGCRVCAVGRRAALKLCADANLSTCSTN